MASAVSVAVTARRVGKWEQAFAEITNCAHQEAVKANGKIMCLRVNPRLLGEKSTITLDMAAIALETAPLQENELRSVVEEINVSCTQSMLPYGIAFAGLLMLGAAAMIAKFCGKMWANQHGRLVWPLAAGGFQLILFSFAARALGNQRLAGQMCEELSKLNLRFAPQNIRFDLHTWRYLLQWHQQHVGSERTIEATSCECFTPLSPCLFNLAQYVLVIQEKGLGGYLL